MLALFPFEPAIYEASGIPVTFVGHPLAQTAATHATRREMRRQWKLGADTPVFALLPGSRAASWTCTASSCCNRRGDSRDQAGRPLPGAARDATTRDASKARCTARCREAAITLLYGHAGDAMKLADVAVVCSGTATLEARSRAART
jgi:lipid-A-disaccharide synthase